MSNYPNNGQVAGMQGNLYNQQLNIQGAAYNPQFDPVVVRAWENSNSKAWEHDAKNASDVQYQKNIKEIDLNYKAHMLRIEELHSQQVKEASLASCEVVDVNEKGEICIKTENLAIEAKPRTATNFRCTDVISYLHVTNSQEKVIQLRLELDTSSRNEVFVFLNPEKCEKKGYIEKKLLAVGAVIYANSIAKKNEYAKMIIAYIIRKCTKTIELPDIRGWYVVDGNMQFFDGLWTWEELVRNAK